jgi:hypothetical protein
MFSLYTGFKEYFIVLAINKMGLKHHKMCCQLYVREFIMGNNYLPGGGGGEFTRNM